MMDKGLGCKAAVIDSHKMSKFFGVFISEFFHTCQNTLINHRV
jgi:hypothetical protein